MPCKRLKEIHRCTDKKKGEKWQHNERNSDRCQVGYLILGFFHGLFIHSIYVWCNIAKQSLHSPFIPLPLHPLRSLDLHCTPLSTLVGDHIWAEPALGTPTMVCKIQLHEPLMAFEGAWLLTTRDSWIAPWKRQGLWIRGGKRIKSSGPQQWNRALFPRQHFELD